MSDSKTTFRARRRRHTAFFYERVRALSALTATEANAACLVRLADVLTAWTRAMLEINPASAARFYSALVEVWEDNRCGLYDASDLRDARERLTCEFHGAFIARSGELFNEPPPPGRLIAVERTRAAALAARVSEMCAALARRAPSSFAPRDEAAPIAEAIETASAFETAEDADAPRVVDLDCWRQSRARPIRRPLFNSEEQ